MMWMAQIEDHLVKMHGQEGLAVHPHPRLPDHLASRHLLAVDQRIDEGLIFAFGQAHGVPEMVARRASLDAWEDDNQGG